MNHGSDVVSQETHERASKPTLKERAIEELHSFKLIAGYLFVCFAVLMFYESTLPGGAEAGVFSLGTAAIKAAVLAKFLLLGQALGVGEKARVTRWGPAVFAKSVQLWLLVIALSVAEELLVGRVHGKSFGATLAEFESRSMAHVLAKSLVVLLVLLPLIATREFSRTLGPGVLRGILAGKSKV
ncbi:MAG: hypothetical protein KBF50_08405 [Steroidobacteraceae bacterium]|jgi:hypothetical protein|nr:hypothetical protein [Steroidobacteraceae bacterium]